MNILTTNILDIISPLIDDDITAYHLSIHRNEMNKETKKTAEKLRDNYARYLISVATHSIGLSSSLAPFDCSQEQMMAFIVDMFKVSKKKVQEMLGYSTSTKSTLVPVKRHHWRPELRIRLGPPIFSFIEEGYIERLRVRVYLIKSEQKRKDIVENSINSDQKLVLIFQKISSKLRNKPDFFVRPMTDMLIQIQFGPIPDGGLGFHNVQVTEGERIVRDVNIPIRRYYCDPETLHTIRFEFWIDGNKVNGHLPSSFSKALSLFRSSSRQEKSEKFVGYTSLDLSEIPSYAIKQTLPILGIRGKKITNCDITVEPKNRRLESEPARFNFSGSSSKSETTRLKFIINHLRLYANCLLYQSLLLADENHRDSDIELILQELSLDNLLYLPAHSLINQHRLQSNLTFFDDTSLRRSSMLLLLIQLELKKLDCNFSDRLSVVKLALYTILKNEYLTTYQLVDDRTMQEVNPFRDRLADSSVTTLVTELEAATLREFISQVLTKKLKDSFVPTAITRSQETFYGRNITLMCLRLCRLALEHLCSMSHRIISERLRQDLLAQKGMLEQLLCEISVEHIVESVIRLLSGKPDQNVQYSTIGVNPLESCEDLTWSDLLSGVHAMNNDIHTYWSRQGLRGLMQRHIVFLQNSKLLNRLYQNEVTTLIIEKVEKYLS